MAYKIRLVPSANTGLILFAETPLAGVALSNAITANTRRAIPESYNIRHITLGDVYEMYINVPSNIAIASGKFADIDEITVIVADNYLKDYLFYITREQPNRNLSLMFHSYHVLELLTGVDELAIMEEWITSGYSTTLPVPEVTP